MAFSISAWLLSREQCFRALNIWFFTTLFRIEIMWVFCTFLQLMYLKIQYVLVRKDTEVTLRYTYSF
jgi:hypothetical protein